MSIYDFATFKNSSFGETISYTPSGGVAANISAVVFRKGEQKITGKMGDQTAMYYPVVIEVDREDIDSVTVNEDIVSCDDVNGEAKSFRVRAILSSDAGCFKLGLG